MYSVLNVTTCTFEYKYDGAVDLGRVVESTKEGYPFTSMLGITGHWHYTANEFQNSVTVKCSMGESMKTATIFKNGSVKVAGIKDSIDVADVKRFLDAIMCSEVRQIRCSMANGKVNVNSNVNLVKFKDMLTKRSFFDKDLYFEKDPEKIVSAIKMRVELLGEDAKIFVYASGCVMIHARGFRHMCAVYHYVLKLVDSAKDDVLFERETKRDSAADLIRGYPIGELHRFFL